MSAGVAALEEHRSEYYLWNERHCHHNRVLVVGHRHTLHNLPAVQTEGIPIQVGCRQVLPSGTSVAITHRIGHGLTGITTRRLPVAEALGKRRSRAVGVSDSKGLRSL